jgi:FkbM family methyltransferase
MGRFPSKASALEFIRSAGVEFGTIIDVGVLHRTEELIDAFPKHRHILFEPVPHYEQVIRRNYAALDYELVQVAVSDRTGTQTLELERSLDDPTRIKRAQIIDGPTNYDVIEVATTTLDDYFAAHRESSPYFLKIDVDGHEMPILRGATTTLANSACVMLEVYLNSWTERQAYLESLNFVLVDVVDFHYYRDKLAQADIIMMPRKLVGQNARLSPSRFYGWDWRHWKRLVPETR